MPACSEVVQSLNVGSVCHGSMPKIQCIREFVAGPCNPTTDYPALAMCTPELYENLADWLGCVVASRAAASWMPPEAAAAAAEAAERQSCWTCTNCTLVNSSSSRTCEVCGVLRPSADVQPGQSHEPEASANAPASTAVKPKPRKLPKFERLRVTGGDGGATHDWLEKNGAVPVRPQNVWTHRRAAAEAVGGAAAPSVPVAAPQEAKVKNRWAQSGSLAQQVSSVQNAWAKR